MTRLADAVAHMKAKGIVMVYRTSHVPELKTGWMPTKLTKTDQFYRLGGKIVSKNFAREAWSLGLAVA